MSKKIVIAAGVASGLACLMPLTALAQAAATAASPAASAPSSEISRVIITAQKRKEDIRDVPLSVSVMSGEQLQAAQISTVEDLTRNVPNISFSTQGGPGLGTVEIRGVSSQAGAATVSVYLDDVSLTTRNLYSQGTAEPRFFDLQDVEVLRGPQGTLYGASSLGGTIKFISKQPDLKFFSAATTDTVSWTQNGGLNYEAQGVINVPLVTGRIALRLGVEHGHDSGYIDQVDQTTLKRVAKDINHDDYTVVKAALKADLGAGWSVTPALFTQQTNTGDIDATYAATQGGTTLGRFQTSKTVREPGHDLLVIPSATVTGDTGIGTFTGVLSGYKRRFNRVQDGTSINDPSFAVINPNDPNPPPANIANLITTLDGLSSQVNLSNKIDQTALELRMTSKDYDPASGRHFTWIAGAFAQDAFTSVYDDEPIPGVQAAFAAAGVDPTDPNQVGGGFPGAFANDDSYNSVRHYHDKQESVFGELTFHASKDLAMTVGLRQLHATQKFTREALTQFYDGPTPSTPGYGGQAPVDAKWNATTPSVKVNWELAPDVTLYWNASKGFRLGGANRPVPDTPIVETNLQKLGLPPGVPAAFQPDSLWSYEFGSKMDLLDHTMSLNVAAYLLKWKNIQQDITLSDAGFDFETNVGNATSYGLEAELKARVTQSLTLSTALGFTHASFDSDNPAFGTADDGQPNIRKGDWVEGVPRATASFGADYHWAVNDSVNAFVRGNGQWTGKSHGTVFRGDADYNRAAYFTADASAGVNWDKWEVTAFVKNLNNNHTALQHPNVQNVSEVYYMRPRTIGVKANYEF
jgi:outer membrane receptor protein involved in Fe transport